jgi:hypothetical protein
MKLSKIIILPLFILAVNCLLADNPSTNHVCSSEKKDEHLDNPKFDVQAYGGGPYALSGSNVEVNVSGNIINKTNGLHQTVEYPCSCKNLPPIYYKPYKVFHNRFKYSWWLAPEPKGMPEKWKNSGDGDSFSDTAYVYTAGVYSVTAQFTGYCGACAKCTFSASTNAEFRVYQLTATNTPWLGLDRTDAGPLNKTGGGEAFLTPPDPATFTWELKSVGEAPVVCLLENTSGKTVKYSTQDKEQCSTNYLDQILEVTAKITSPKPFSLSTTTNFTVVKVDVTIGEIGEDKEEMAGAYIGFEADDQEGSLTTEGKSALKNVSLKCWPENLPTNEIIKIEAPEGFLYEKIGDVYTNALTFYQASELNKKQFFLHGHVTSGGLSDKVIVVTHETSKATDMAKFTVFDVTGFYQNYTLSLDKVKVLFRQDGLVEKFKLTPEPDPIAVKMRWNIIGTQGEVTWSSSLAYVGYPATGTGSRPTMYIKFKNNPNLEDGTPDYMPPSNSEFGRKKYNIVVQIGTQLTITRKIHSVSFAGSLGESKIMDGKQVSAWYFYYRDNNAYPSLENFIYKESIGGGNFAGWDPVFDKYYIARIGYTCTQKPVIINGTYGRVLWHSEYPEYNGLAVHSVAKLCLHEETHRDLNFEIVSEWRPTALYPGGVWVRLNDDDGDGLPNEREAESMMNPLKKDTFAFCAVEVDDTGNSLYTSYADQELYCRLISMNEIGEDAKDWEQSGHNVSCLSCDGENE